MPSVITPCGGAGHVIQDEGSDLAQRANLNFVGAGVTATDDPPDTTLVTIPGTTSTGADLASAITGLTGLDGFWKLNESSGVVAADSSGNGYTMSDAGGGAGPVYAWGSTVGPPGETSALFNGPGSSDGFGNSALPLYTDNVTFLGWVKDGQLVVGGYGGGFFGASARGWGLVNRIVGGSYTTQLWVTPAPSYTTVFLTADAPLPSGWVMLAARRDNGTWTMFIDGVLQSTTISTTPSMTGVGTFHLATDHAGAGFYGNLSYMALFGRALTDAEIVALYSVPGTGYYPAGYVYTSDGAGGAYWAQP